VRERAAEEEEEEETGFVTSQKETYPRREEFNYLFNRIRAAECASACLN
jgi:hypothetical protein